jgi:hypothetical protein
MTKFFSKMQYGYLKRLNFMLISNPSKKLQKTHAKKFTNEKVTEIWSFFYFNYCVQKFLSYKCFGWTFELFVTGFELSIEFWVLWYPYQILAKKLFFLHYHSLLTLSQTRTKGLKKTKNVFRIPFTSISGRGGSILSKKSQSLNPTVLYISKDSRY